MRLIDADALKEHIMQSCLFATEWDYALVKQAIDAQFAIELNQCKNCVHYNEEIAICYYHGVPTMPEAFCSDGERVVKDETN